LTCLRNADLSLVVEDRLLVVGTFEIVGERVIGVQNHRRPGRAPEEQLQVKNIAVRQADRNVQIFDGEMVRYLDNRIVHPASARLRIRRDSLIERTTLEPEQLGTGRAGGQTQTQKQANNNRGNITRARVHFHNPPPNRTITSVFLGGASLVPF